MSRAAVTVFCYFLLIGVAYPNPSEDKIFLLSSNPNNVAAFHYLRGRYYFLGFTPINISKSDLDGKSAARILLTKFGYQRQLIDLNIDGKNKFIKLNAIAPSFVIGDAEKNSKLEKCISGLDQKLAKLISRGVANQIDLQLPVRWVQTDEGLKIVAFANILNRDDIIAIKKTLRKNKDSAIVKVQELVDPFAQMLLGSFKDLGCFKKLLLIAVYQDKGMKIDFTPYRNYWSSTSQYTIDSTTYITTSWGYSMELQKDMIVTKKEKSFLFEYILK